MPSEKALLVAANPYISYRVSPGRVTRQLGDVDFHREHRNRFGSVFWDVIPSGRPSLRDSQWVSEIHSGYFYVARDMVVRYWMSIDSIKRWRDIDQRTIERYAPEPRRAYLQSYPDSTRYYAILIDEIEPLQVERKLEDFTLAGTDARVKRLRNYAIVNDPEWR